MNEQLQDPILRTFRKPLTERLRERLDYKQAVIDTQFGTIAKMGRENAALQRDLRRMGRELAKATVRTHRAETLLLHGQGGNAGTNDVEQGIGEAIPTE